MIDNIMDGRDVCQVAGFSRQRLDQLRKLDVEWLRFPAACDILNGGAVWHAQCVKKWLDLREFLWDWDNDTRCADGN